MKKTKTKAKRAPVRSRMLTPDTLRRLGACEPMVGVFSIDFGDDGARISKRFIEGFLTKRSAMAQELRERWLYRVYWLNERTLPESAKAKTRHVYLKDWSGCIARCPGCKSDADRLRLWAKLYIKHGPRRSLYY